MSTVPLSQRSQLPLWRTVLMFILPGSFHALLVCLPVLGTRRFGVATAVHLIPALPVQFYTVPLPATPPPPLPTVCRDRSSPLRGAR